MKTSRLLSLVLGVGLCFVLLAMGVTQEVPVGQLRAVVVMSENGKPIKGAIVSVRSVGQPEETAYHRTFVSDKDGVISARQLPAGAYTVDASARAHKLEPTVFVVEEGQRKDLELQLEPIPPFLDLYASQHVFTPDERPSIEVHGFTAAAEIDVKVYRIDTDKVIAAGQLEAVLLPLQTYEYSDRVPKNPSTVGKLIVEKSHQIQNRDIEGVFVEALEMPKLVEGIYWLQAKAGGKSRSTYLNVTRMALVTKMVGDQVLCYTTRIDTGRPMPGVKVGYSDGKAFVPMAVTDAQGMARYEMKPAARPRAEGESEGGYRSAIAIEGNSFALTSSYLFGEGKNPLRMYIYTDRPVYRPGDRVHFKGLIRKPAGLGYALPDVKEVAVEYRSPDQSLLKSETLSVTPSGAFVGSFEVSKEGETGGYSIVASAPGTKYTKHVPIQAYRKPQFQVEVKPDKPTFVRGEKASATIKCSYYSGGPVIGADVECFVMRQPFWGEESGYVDYGGGEYFDSLERVKTDERGEARIEFGTLKKDDPKRAEQDYVYTISAYVSDEGNQTFEARGNFKVVRGEYDLQVDAGAYIASLGKPIAAAVSAKSHTGQPLKGVRVLVTTFTSDWQSGKEMRIEPRETEVTTDEKGQATVTVTPPRAGAFRIEAMSRDSRGNEIVNQSSVWIEGGPVQSFNPETPKLSVTFDKRTYKPGETAKVMVETSVPGGTALITLEAEGIYWAKTVELKQNVTVTQVPISADCAPNVWASVCYVHGKTFNEATERVKVEAIERNLSVQVTTDKKVYQPGETVKLTVQTRNDKGEGVPAEVSVGVVDEGVYAILEDQTDIKEGFYPGRENRVVTAYSFPELYLDGGDKAAPKVDIRRDFRDTAYWNPIVQTDATGRAELAVQLPDNLTEWRATVVGATLNTAVGMGRTSFIARKPLMVRLSAPRFLVVGDEQRLVAQVANDTGREANVQVQIEADRVVLDGGARRQLRIADGGQESLEWTMSASRSGLSTIIAKAWIEGGESDGVELKLAVKPYGRLVQDQFADDLVDRSSFDLELRPGSDPDSTQLRLVLTPSAALSLIQSLEELMGYPYGCVEQTMSRFLPSVVVSQMAKSGKIPRFQREKDVPRFVTDGYTRLARMQHNDGGWGWWETDASDPFMTAYVLEGMHIAGGAGYKPNPFSVEKASKWAAAYLERAKEVGANEAYLAYALCLYGQTDVAAKALAKVQMKGDVSLKAAHLAMAYRTMGPEFAGQLAEARQTLLGTLDSGATTSRWPGDRYDDEVNARCLMALATIEPGHPDIPKVARYLMLKRKGDGWASTRGTAFAVLGLAKTLGPQVPLVPGSRVDVRLNGQTVKTVELSAAAIDPNGLKLNIPLTGLKTGTNHVDLVKNAPGTAFYSATFEQTVQRRRLGEVISGSGLRIDRQYFLMSVQTADDGKKRFMPARIPSLRFQKGDLLKCVVTISSDVEREFLIVEDPLPAGFKVTENVFFDPYLDWNYEFNALDVRDDRVATFFRHARQGKTTFSYMMRAESPGRATALPAVIYNMYDTRDRASSEETALEVRE